MSFKKNLRGAETFAPPATPKYLDNYDRIFGAKSVTVPAGAGLVPEQLQTAPGKVEHCRETVWISISVERHQYLIEVERLARDLVQHVEDGDEAYDTQVGNLVDFMSDRGTSVDT